jgi:hypothetical protein
MKKLFLIFLSLWLIPSIALSIGISYEDETSYEDMRGSFYDGQSWWCGQQLGAELLSNSDFSAWTGDNPTSWSVLNENASNYITEHVDGARLVSNDTSSIYMFQAAAAVPLDYYRVQVTISNYVQGDCSFGIYDVSHSVYIKSAANMGWTANGTYSYYVQAPAGCTSIRIYIFKGSGMSTDLVYSLCSLKQVTSPNTQPGTISNGDLIVLDDSAGKYAYGYVKLGEYNELVSPLYGGDETLGTNLFDQNGGSGGAGDKGAFTLADLRLAELSSGTLTAGIMYEISARTDGNFTDDGAPDNVVGTTFIATGTSVTLDAGDKVYPVDISWVKFGTNLVNINGDALHVTYVDDIRGARQYLRLSNDLTSNLTAEKLYKLTGTAKVNVKDPAANVDIILASSIYSSSRLTVTSTFFIPFELYITSSSATSDSIYFANLSAGKEIWLDNLKFYEVTAPPLNAVEIYKERGLVNQGWFQIDTGSLLNKGANSKFDIYRHPGAKQNW